MCTGTEKLTVCRGTKVGAIRNTWSSTTPLVRGGGVRSLASDTVRTRYIRGKPPHNRKILGDPFQKTKLFYYFRNTYFVSVLWLVFSLAMRDKE